MVQISDVSREITGPQEKLMTVGFLMLDESGSMAGGREATMDTFNEYFSGLAKSDEEFMFSVSTFSLRYDGSNMIRPLITYAAVDGPNCPKLTVENYIPGGNTPLYDAIGHAIRDIEVRLTKMKFNPLVIIQTDGRENSSKEFTQQVIFDLVKAKQDAGWQFIFLGCNMDAMKVSTSMGFARGSTISYDYNTISQMGGMMATASVNYAACGNNCSDVFGAAGADLTGIKDSTDEDSTDSKTPH